MTANPAAIRAIPAPSATNVTADRIIVPEVSFPAAPTAFSPAATPNNLPAIFPMPFPASPKIAFENVTIPGATALAILNPLYARYNFGSKTITFATVSECSSKNPENVAIPSFAVPITSEKFLMLSVLPNEPVSLLISVMIAPVASPSALPASIASIFSIFQYGVAFRCNSCIL